jgi:LysM repeat protein
MDFDFELAEILDYVRNNLFVVLAVVIMALLLVGYLVFALRTIMPRWQARTALIAQAAAVEAAYANRALQQQAVAGQISQQIETAQTDFNQTANHFLTETQAAAYLADLYNSANVVGVTIVDLQAQVVPRAASADGEKPVYDTRLFRLVVEGDLPQLNQFVGRIETAPVPSVTVKNLRITRGEADFADLLSLDLLLYTSPFATGEAVAQLPDDGASSPPPISLPTPTAAVPPTPDVASLLTQLDEPWAAENWPEVIRLIQEIRQQAPNEPEMAEKLYAARVNYGYQLAGVGETAAAAEQFELALALFPDGGEAELGLQSLFTPEATATPSVTIHTVQRGDTLFSIARRYGCTVDAVKAANGLVGNNITPGQQLIIP